jgi:hypothetical protein
MAKTETKIIGEYARMWPRNVLYLDSELLQEVRQLLDHSGVYVLYRDENPYYVGKADRLFVRIMQHANNPRKLQFNFWNYFSAYVIPNKAHIAEIEGVLITSMVMTTENRQKPRINRIALPSKVW